MSGSRRRSRTAHVVTRPGFLLVEFRRSRGGLSGARWLLLSLAAVTFAAMLFARGYAVESLGRSTTVERRPARTDSNPLLGAGAILDLTGPRLRSVHAPERMIALTFDDGPDRTWTPRVLEVLRRRRVPATFFVVGSAVLRHPELLRAELGEGHELGVHTFNHVDITAVPRWRSDLELATTNTAIAGAGGVRTLLMRPPYSATPRAVDEPALHAYRRVARRGYAVVLADVDSEDWRRRGENVIEAAILPPGDRGAVVLLHDGGGNRSETVAAVDRAIGTLQDRGYRFVTVSEMAGLSRSQVMALTTRAERWRGAAMLATMRVALPVTGLALALVVPVTLLFLGRALVMFVFARRFVRRTRSALRVEELLPPVSLVVPAYNEEVGIERAVRSMAGSRYPSLEVLVVDDGSTDRTAEIVTDLQLPNVRVVREAHRGKPRAINAGIAASSHDIVVMADGDTLFEADTVRWLVQPFADPAVGAVSGSPKVGNRAGLLGRWQHIEYEMGNLERRMYATLDCLPTIPGAVGALRRQALADVGGLSDDTLAEDDLAMAVNRAGWRVAYEARAVAWTESPATFAGLWRQRYRWSYGILQSAWKHRAAMWSGDGGHLGRRGLPYLVSFHVVLVLLAPLIDLFTVYGALFLNTAHVLAFWSAFTLVQLGLAVYAMRLGQEPLGPLWAVPVQQLVYRQLLYLVLVSSMVSALLGIRLPWNKLARSGEVTPASLGLEQRVRL